MTARATQAKVTALCPYLPHCLPGRAAARSALERTSGPVGVGVPGARCHASNHLLESDSAPLVTAAVCLLAVGYNRHDASA